MRVLCTIVSVIFLLAVLSFPWLSLLQRAACIILSSVFLLMSWHYDQQIEIKRLTKEINWLHGEVAKLKQTLARWEEG